MCHFFQLQQRIEEIAGKKDRPTNGTKTNNDKQPTASQAKKLEATVTPSPAVNLDANSDGDVKR